MHHPNGSCKCKCLSLHADGFDLLGAQVPELAEKSSSFLESVKERFSKVLEVVSKLDGVDPRVSRGLQVTEVLFCSVGLRKEKPEAGEGAKEQYSPYCWKKRIHQGYKTFQC